MVYEWWLFSLKQVVSPTKPTDYTYSAPTKTAVVCEPTTQMKSDEEFRQIFEKESMLAKEAMQV